ncbi:glycosyltransferase [Prauserella shujinwangii]|uniref:Glycosyltransferase n=1 Tax=Prauserella shujinwangii TaxID=1453103 RepID=A0A2T0M3Y5_9PSEU|nr:glycosyltransferase [Prauserella shujinwangii]PRX51436.1 glycosyltransferase [Prauserella shujinwangii]
MRLLFITCGGATVQALATLATAARTAGHQVIVTSQEESVDAIAALGLPAVSVTPLTFVEAIFHDREGRPVPPPPDADSEWVFAGQGFARMAAASYPAVDEIARDWKPDIVVGGTHSHAAALVARRHGIPYVRQAWDMHERDERAVRPAAEELRPELTALGLDAIPEPDIDIEIAPPSILPGNRRPDRFMRCLPTNHQRPLEPWVYRRPEGRKRVLMTTGSRAAMDPEHLGAPFFGRMLDVPALASDDVEVVIATMDEIAAELRSARPDVRAGWVPLDSVTWTADLFVHHGGGVTAMTALAAGVPQLVLPEIYATAEAFYRVDRLGASITFPNNLEPVENVAAACEKMLSDPSYAARAAELGEETLALPAPGEVLGSLEELAGR